MSTCEERYRALVKEVDLLSDILDLVERKSSSISRLYMLIEKEYELRNKIVNEYKEKFGL